MGKGREKGVSEGRKRKAERGREVRRTKEKRKGHADWREEMIERNSRQSKGEDKKRRLDSRGYMKT